MKFAERKGWTHLYELAQANERELRQISLIRAYSWVEHALGAVGLRRGRDPVSKLLYQAYEREYFSVGLRIEAVRKAIQTRHLAAHMDTVPKLEDCLEAVKVLCDVWECLRNHYVTISNAATIAQKIFSKEGILSVSIFGSLARGESEPKDIDLLVLDDGRYSDNVDPLDHQYLDTAKLTRTALKLLDLLHFPFPHVINCRWFDIIILNGTLFGKDLEYTRSIAKYQPDPYFFLNIAQDIRDYDLHANCFIDTNIFVFLELRNVGHTLRKIGFR